MNKRPLPPIDRRNEFQVKPATGANEPDLVVTIRPAPAAARWIHRPRVLLSNGTINKGGKRT